VFYCYVTAAVYMYVLVYILISHQIWYFPLFHVKSYFLVNIYVELCYVITETNYKESALVDNLI